ncbi:hypothetical protein Drorol1_Dr00019129 [Drosera rotundifolia]
MWCAPGMEGVVSVFPSRTLRLHTTRSWDFMGFPRFLLRNPVFESDVVMGVLDTGIWPESEGFNDKGIGPVLKKWKGACHGGEDFTCNRCPKLCMRRLGKGPRWTWNSHASIAAGRLTKNANYYGLGQGSARGAVPSARIAANKVCEPPPHGCPEFAIMAAFDDAIADGVDIISISAGPGLAGPFDGDSVALGASYAMAKGVLTVQSAGSSDPESSCVCSVALWLLTVAVSNTDRRYFNKLICLAIEVIVLVHTGCSIDIRGWNREKVPLLYGKDVTSTCNEIQARMCQADCLDHHIVKEKIVIGDTAGDEVMCSVKAAGASGTIVDVSFEDVSQIVTFSAAELIFDDLELVKAYKNSSL